MAYVGEYNWDEVNRQEILRGQQILERTSQSINNSQRIAIETEEVGVGVSRVIYLKSIDSKSEKIIIILYFMFQVINELNEQRESLLRSRNRLQNMDEGLSKSQRLIRAMSRHVLYNKILLIFIIILEVGILAGLVYLKFFRKQL